MSEDQFMTNRGNGSIPTDHFLCIFQNCRRKKILQHAKRAHGHLCNNGLHPHATLGNFIVPMFVECASVSDAQQAFNRLLQRNEHSWTSLMLGYIESGQTTHALSLYPKMQEDSVLPSTYTLAALLRACTRLRDVEKGRQIHVEIRKNGFEKDIHVGSSLIDMYAKCGAVAEAEEVFNGLPVRDIVLWNTMLSAYAENGFAHKALKYLELMQLNGCRANGVTFLACLKACVSLGSIAKGRELHTEVLQSKLTDMYISSSLVDMYVRCCSVAEAGDMFDTLSEHNTVSWTVLITGCVECGYAEEALKIFNQMKLEGMSPSAVTYMSILKACGSLQDLDKGREVHMDILQKGLSRDLNLGNTLVDMYVKCGSVAEAKEVFYGLLVRDTVSWNILISGYVEDGLNEEALECFHQMQIEGSYPDQITFVCSLKACGNTRAIDRGQEIHAVLARRGLVSVPVIGNALVDMYAKCGCLLMAREVFENLRAHDVVSWNTLIGAYTEYGLGQEALSLFEQMQLEGISGDACTYVYGLKACGNIGAISKGQEIHAEIRRKELDENPFVGNSLVDMFVKCGALEEAWQTFQSLPIRDIISWNTMIKGFGTNNDVNMAVKCFERMEEQGVKPDAITFTCLLSACSRANLVHRGKSYLKLMIEKYHIKLTADHHTCVIDLLARSGYLLEAENLLATVLNSRSVDTWMALLSACKTFEETEVGLRCFHQLVDMDPENAAPYVLMANIYLNAGKWDDADRIKALRKPTGAKKEPERALIEENKVVHEFQGGEQESGKCRNHRHSICS